MKKPIYIVGFMGSGKTTVGKRLAERLDLPFVDLDDDIEAAAGRTISTIFAEEGEAAFRDLEHLALRRRVERSDAEHAFVLALGGGAFTFERNRQLLAGSGVSIWLDCSYERAFARVQGFAHRPLAKDPVRFHALYKERTAAYAHAAVRIPIHSDDPEETVSQILEQLQ